MLCFRQVYPRYRRRHPVLHHADNLIYLTSYQRLWQDAALAGHPVAAVWWWNVQKHAGMDTDDFGLYTLSRYMLEHVMCVQNRDAYAMYDRTRIDYATNNDSMVAMRQSADQGLVVAQYSIWKYHRAQLRFYADLVSGDFDVNSEVDRATLANFTRLCDTHRKSAIDMAKTLITSWRGLGPHRRFNNFMRDMAADETLPLVPWGEWAPKKEIHCWVDNENHERIKTSLLCLNRFRHKICLGVQLLICHWIITK